MNKFICCYTLEDYQVISGVIDNFSWQSHEISSFSDYFFARLPQARIIEKITGADRFSVRFIVNEYEYFLHTESNSESIWIEPCEKSATIWLNELYRLLDNNK